MKQKTLNVVVLALVSIGLLSSTSLPEQNTSEEKKKAAFSVLEIKCNSCHKDENKARVFIYDTMDEEAGAIYKQVFVKKRMPKRKSPQLTDEEKRTLLDWLDTQIEQKP